MSAATRAPVLGLSTDDLAHLEALCGREPSPLEVQLAGALWSEHCSYRSSRALLARLPASGAAVRSGAGENAGVVDVGGGVGLAVKVESHNHPSAIEPYQGAATGVGGILRDILAMGAQPVALLNALRFGPPREAADRRTVREVVRGIAGYGNAVGVPTVGGDTRLDPTCAGNPLVNVMAVGLLAPGVQLTGAARVAPGEDRVFVLYGARTGRDGLGGAAFASVDLDEHAETRRPQVQVGDPFTGRRLIDATLELVQAGMVVALQDLGAAGLASALVEMAAAGGAGARVDLDAVPLRETGLEPATIFLSESQERMLALVRHTQLDAITEVLCRHGLAWGVLGPPTTDGRITAMAAGRMLADIPAQVLSRGAPARTADSPAPAFSPPVPVKPPPLSLAAVPARIEAMLSTPELGSRRPIHSQFDSKVQSRTIAGPAADAALLLHPDGRSAVALVLVSSRHGDLDPYRSAVQAVATAALRVSAAGARPLAVTDGLNLGNPQRPRVMRELAATVEGIRDACLALGLPVVSGNVSLYNEYPGGAVAPVAAIGMVGRLEDLGRRVSSGFRHPGDVIALVGRRSPDLHASCYEAMAGLRQGPVPLVDLDHEVRIGALLRELAGSGHLHSAHPVGEGGLAVALVECLTADLGLRIRLPETFRLDTNLFGEEAGAVLLSLRPEDLPQLDAQCRRAAIPWLELGRVTADPRLHLATAQGPLELDGRRLRSARTAAFAAVLA